MQQLNKQLDSKIIKARFYKFNCFKQQAEETATDILPLSLISAGCIFFLFDGIHICFSDACSGYNPILQRQLVPRIGIFSLEWCIFVFLKLLPNLFLSMPLPVILLQCIFCQLHLLRGLFSNMLLAYITGILLSWECIL